MPITTLNIESDGHLVLKSLQKGGTAIIPTSLGYTVIASTPTALHKIFTAKSRPPHKKHAMVGSYTLHQSIHVLPSAQESLVHMITEIQDLPLGVVAPYEKSHPLLARLGGDMMEACTDNDTLAMLVNGGPFQEELVRIAALSGVAVFGSSANLSGKGTKSRVEDVEEEVRRVADVVVDYGCRVFGFPGGNGGRGSSTMLDFSPSLLQSQSGVHGGGVRVVRMGACYEVIRDVLGRFGGEFGRGLPVDPGVGDIITELV